MTADTTTPDPVDDCLTHIADELGAARDDATVAVLARWCTQRGLGQPAARIAARHKGPATLAVLAGAADTLPAVAYELVTRDDADRNTWARYRHLFDADATAAIARNCASADVFSVLLDQLGVSAVIANTNLGPAHALAERILTDASVAADWVKVATVAGIGRLSDATDTPEKLYAILAEHPPAWSWASTTMFDTAVDAWSLDTVDGLSHDTHRQVLAAMISARAVLDVPDSVTRVREIAAAGSIDDTLVAAIDSWRDAAIDSWRDAAGGSAPLTAGLDDGQLCALISHAAHSELPQIVAELADRPAPAPVDAWLALWDRPDAHETTLAGLRRLGHTVQIVTAIAEHGTDTERLADAIADTGSIPQCTFDIAGVIGHLDRCDTRLLARLIRHQPTWDVISQVSATGLWAWAPLEIVAAIDAALGSDPNRIDTFAALVDDWDGTIGTLAVAVNDIHDNPAD